MPANTEVVMRFEQQFKNHANLAIVDELMTPGFTHHAAIPGIPPGPEGMKAIGAFVFSLIEDIHVDVQLMLAEGDLVADRVLARGRMKEGGAPVAWTENHIYRIEDGRIAEWWGEGAPPSADARPRRRARDRRARLAPTRRGGHDAAHGHHPHRARRRYARLLLGRGAPAHPRGRRRG